MLFLAAYKPQTSLEFDTSLSSIFDNNAIEMIYMYTYY